MVPREMGSGWTIKTSRSSSPWPEILEAVRPSGNHSVHPYLYHEKKEKKREKKREKKKEAGGTRPKTTKPQISGPLQARGRNQGTVRTRRAGMYRPALRSPGTGADPCDARCVPRITRAPQQRRTIGAETGDLRCAIGDGKSEIGDDDRKPKQGLTRSSSSRAGRRRQARHQSRAGRSRGPQPS